MRYSALLLSLVCLLQAAAQTGPGGVGTNANNKLWLAADHGVSHLLGLVTSWSDRSGNGNDAFPPLSIPLASPVLVTNSVNGRPSLDFDGINDQLWVADNNGLDLTQWHFFLVLTADVQKDHNAWMVKGDDADENYEMLSYADGNMHIPVKWTDGTRTSPSSAGGQVVTGTFDIFEYSYSAAVGRNVYKNATNIHTDTENKTPKVNNLPLYIGNERSTFGREVRGDIAEVIAYNAPVNSAQRIIVNNYLAAKYARNLGANDLYVQDNPANGNYDFDVAAIGRVNSSNQQTSSRGSGIVQMSKATYTGLDDGEFLFWGHDNGVLGTWGIADLPPGLQGRWARTWRVNEVNLSGTAVDVGNVDAIFDLAGLGPVVPADLRLLVDTDNDGYFFDETPIAGASSAGGSLYQFTNISAMVNNRRFTLGTTNISTTPLPIELLSFTAEAVDDRSVQLDWVTASELNNHHFTVQRSMDMQQWQEVATIAAIGNSIVTTAYTLVDEAPHSPICYYRLQQTDVDGTTTTSDAVAVRIGDLGTMAPFVYPNPSTGPMTVVLPEATDEPVYFSLIDLSGRSTPVRHQLMAPGNYRIDPGGEATSAYVLRIEIGDGMTTHHVRILR